MSQQQHTLEQNQLIQREQKREFFIQTPAMIDYVGLTPHEFRLYSHYIRVCGDSGACWESVRTTAENCTMGLGTITRARTKLVELNLVTAIESERESGTINVTINDIWEINSEFLVLIRKHGMPTLPAAKKWLQFQLAGIENAELNTKSDDSIPADEFFKVAPEAADGCSTGEQGVPPARAAFHRGTGCSTGEQGVPPARAAFHTGTPRSTGEPNKISSNKIPVNQIPNSQIPLIAAAAGSQLIKENSTANERSTRAREGDQEIWWNVADEWVSRAAVERVCCDYMGLDDWRDRDQIITTADTGELLDLMLWLKYSSWHGLEGIENVPGYIRSRYKSSRPDYSQNDIQNLLNLIQQYTEQDKIPF